MRERSPAGGPGEAGRSPSEELAHLDELNRLGVITDAELADKRREVLGRERRGPSEPKGTKGAGLTAQGIGASISPMPTANRAGLSLYFETYGDSEAPPMLLVGGLGMQLVDWPPEWLGRFVKEGYFVVAFDNRDAGLSTHLSSVTPPDPGNTSAEAGRASPTTWATWLTTASPSSTT